MFYCDPCAEVSGWPESFLSRSYGRCEVCGKTSDCNDVPSSFLSPARSVRVENTSEEPAND